MRFAGIYVLSLCLALPAVAKIPDVGPQGWTVVDWSQISAEYQRHRHGMFPDGGGFKARSFEQQWLARFDGRGFTVEPDGADWRWGLELTGVPGGARMTAAVNRLTYHWSADLDEWFLNDTRGLEHGFTLRAPHEIRLAVRGGLRPRAAGAGVEFLDATGTARVRYSELSVKDADGRVLRGRMRVDGSTVRLLVDDRGARYPVTIDPTAQQAYLKASNTNAGDSFGYSVAISGDTVVVGADQESGNATGVNGNQADNSAPGSGAAYVFARTGNTWTQQAYLKASNTQQSAEFGWSVAISGNTIVVGSPGESSNATGVNGNQGNTGVTNSGAAYVFVRNGTTWTQQAYLKASNTRVDQGFGTSAAIDGDTVVVGAPYEDSSATGVNGNQADHSAFFSGAAYVFVRNGTTWTQQAYLKASNTRPQGGFGQSVAISGDTIVVGSYSESSNATGVNGNQADTSAPYSGAVYVFVRSGTTLAQQAYLKASNTPAGAHSAQFGWSVAISGDRIVVGAPFEGSGAYCSGAAYVFVSSGITWAQQAYLKASNPTICANFGGSVAISVDAIAVGAPGESSNAISVNGNQANRSAPSSGAAYLFLRTGNTWTQEAYLKASNTDSGDYFGLSVAISGDTVVVSAYGERSSATGVNGNQADNTAADSGATYVFAGSGAIITSSPTGLLFSSSGSGCTPGTNYVTPAFLDWTPGSSCMVTFGTLQTGGPSNVSYNFFQWENGLSDPTRVILAPTITATYTATFVPAADAQPISVSPPNGLESHQVFTFDARDATSADNIQYTQFLFSKSGLSALNACYISYDPMAKVFYLLSDDTTQWYGLPAGATGTIGNAQCTIYGASSGAAQSGPDLTTTLDISFRSGFAGLKTVYQYTGAVGGATSGWQMMGTWNDTGDPSAVELISLTPNSGSGASQTFTAVIKDGDGASTISFAQLVINGALSGFNGCFIHYDRDSNVFYLLNDGGTAWFGMFAGSGQVSNSKCTLRGAGSGGNAVGSNLTITYNLDFSPGFAGAKQVYMQAVDNTGVIEVWHQMGTWTR